MNKKVELAADIEEVKDNLDQALHYMEKAVDHMNYIDEWLFNEAIRESIGSVYIDGINHKIFNIASTLDDFARAARGDNSDIDLVENEDGELEWDVY